MFKILVRNEKVVDRKHALSTTFLTCSPVMTMQNIWRLLFACSAFLSFVSFSGLSHAQRMPVPDSPSNYVLGNGVGSITGSVSYDPSSLTLPTSVYAYRLTISGGRLIFLQVCVANVDKKSGLYECPQVPEGKYLLVAVPAGRAHPSKLRPDIPTTGVAAFYLDQNFVRVDANQKAIETFAIGKNAFYGLSARLNGTSSDGEITLSIVLDSGRSVRLPIHPFMGNNGDFGFDGLPDGRYRVGTHCGGQDHLVSANTDVLLPQKLDEPVAVTCPGLHTVSLQIDSLSDGHQVPDFQLMEITSGNLYTVVKNEHGGFDVSGIPPGKYRAEIGAGVAGCIELQTLSGGIGNISKSMLELSDGNEHVAVAGRYSSKCLSVKGVLREGNEGDVVVTDDNFRLVTRYRTDNNGNFSIGEFLPETYFLFAWKNSNGIPYNDPHFLSSRSGFATRIILSEDSKNNFLKLETNPDDDWTR